MGTVSNPASFSSIQAAFGGSDPFSSYYRGGPHVPTSAPAGISTTANGLAMSQFNGVSSVVPLSAYVSPMSVSGAISGSKGQTVNCVTNTAVCYASGGSGSYTYAWSLTSGSGSPSGSGINSSSTFSFASTVPPIFGNTKTITGVFQCIVKSSDGQSITISNVNATFEYSYTG